MSNVTALNTNRSLPQKNSSFQHLFSLSSPMQSILGAEYFTAQFPTLSRRYYNIITTVSLHH